MSNEISAQRDKLKAAEAAGDDEEIAAAKALLDSMVNAEEVAKKPVRSKPARHK